jgi:hypothetical protein
MPTHILLRCSWQFEDLDPKNQAVINPTFRRQMDIGDPLSDTNFQSLCDDLGAALTPWSVPGTEKLTIKAYNLEGAKPNYPKAQGVYGIGGPTPLQSVPQQALCLSFYGAQNQPRRRGRLYIPSFLLTTSTAELSAARASATMRAKVAALVPIFAGLGGANVDWVVWSRVAHAAERVQNYFVDESWDIVRRRKLKSTTRTTGTTSG